MNSRHHKIVVKTLPPSSLNFEMTLAFDEEGDQTSIRDGWRLDSGLPAPVEWLRAGRIKSAVAENLKKLKELLEEGQAVLQDGRVAVL